MNIIFACQNLPDVKSSGGLQIAEIEDYWKNGICGAVIPEINAVSY